MTPCPAEDQLRLLLLDVLPPEERVPLEAHLEGCAACREALEQLLATHVVAPRGRPAEAAAPGEFTAIPTAPSDPSPDPPRPPEVVPGYDILGRLGRGGMGVVYRARHRRLDRIVALKMISSGSDASAEERARFRTEAQAAARLQHPNIVQIYEVGEADGQPFFCMEYVEGLGLNRLIDGTPWPALQAARLVETLTRAIGAAHQQGIIHRDLKPANILIGKDEGGRIKDESRQETSEGLDSSFILHPSSFRVKITDFGLAKVLQGGHGHTESGQFLGTPSYAAPEQAGARGFAVGPHTDVYSLGAILYELLTGRPPFRGATLLETIEQVCHREPASLRLLNPAVPADLEAICLKCLEKNPGRRYASAAALAEDLRRWQHHEPTHARPPGPLGRASRWCQRHPALTTVVAVILLALVGITWQWREADRRRREAEAATLLAQKAERDAEVAAAAANEVATFLGGLFEQADPFVLTARLLGEQPNTEPTALDLVDRGAKRLADGGLLKEKPLVRAALLDKVGHVYLSLGEGARATPLLLEALELRRRHLPGDHPDLAASLHNAGFLHLTKGNFTTSKELFTEAMAMRTRLFGADSPLAMSSRFHLAFSMQMLGASPEPLLLEVLAFQRERLKEAEKHRPGDVGPEALECTFTLIALCNYYAGNDRHAEVLPYMAEAILTARKVANTELAALCGHILDWRHCQALRLADKAEESLRRALAALEKRVGRRHYLYVALQRELAYHFYYAQRFDEAEQALLEVEDNFRKTIGGDGQRMAEMAHDTAVSIRRGKLARAEGARDLSRIKEQAGRVERYARAAYRIGKEHGLEEHKLGNFALFLAEFFLEIRPVPDHAAAEQFAREAVRIRGERHGVGHQMTNHPRQYLILALLRQGKVEEVEKHLSDVLARDPHPGLGYNHTDAFPDAARALARAGKARTAMQILKPAVWSWHIDRDEIRLDPAFAPLHGLEEYQLLVGKPPADSDPDRAAAEWVLSRGGKVEVNGGKEVTNAAGLPDGRLVLNWVWMEEQAVRDGGLTRFKGLNGLTYLFLKGTRVTDAGLVHLKGCKALARLSLGNTKVTDDGLVHLKDLKELFHLGVDGTRVTDVGMAHLADCKGLRELWLSDLPLTDAGLARLKGLKRLTYLNLKATQVTAKGMAEFHAAVPGCKIEHNGGTIEPKR